MPLLRSRSGLWAAAPRVLGLVLPLCLPAAALADLFVSPEGRSARAFRVDAVLVDTGDGGDTWIEQISLHNQAPQIVWLRPVPRAPKVRAASGVFDILARGAVRRPELSDRVRAHPFGPSVLTLATQRLRDPVLSVGPYPPPEARPLTLDAVRVFQGTAATSSITGEVSLPPELRAFLRGRDIRLANADRAWLARYLNVGWSVLAAALFDDAPFSSAPARIGPLRFEHEVPDARYPLLRRTSSAGLDFVFYALGEEPLIPKEVPTRAAPRGPDRRGPGGTGAAAITHASALVGQPEVALALADALELPITPELVLTQAFFRPASARLDLLSFVPPAQAETPPSLPSPTRRGSWPDLLSCFVLGFAPLVLTPEAWLVRWLQGRARDSARRGGLRLGVKLGAVWALLVAGYWFFTLEDLARWAALGPLVLGTVQLAVPFSEKEAPPVRATFRRKKEPRSSEAPDTTGPAAS